MSKRLKINPYTAEISQMVWDIHTVQWESEDSAAQLLVCKYGWVSSKISSVCVISDDDFGAAFSRAAGSDPHRVEREHLHKEPRLGAHQGVAEAAAAPPRFWW